MNDAIAIHKLSAQMGLTSRTLRHWESEGLFHSTRDADSGWRTYDSNAVLSVRITALLRKYDIPIKEINSVITNKTFKSLYTVIDNQLRALDAQAAANLSVKSKLKEFLVLIKAQEHQEINDKILLWLYDSLQSLDNPDIRKENIPMSNIKESDTKVRIISLPAMRMVCHMAISLSPEDEAMKPVIDFIHSANLISTARLFGGNMKPMPSGYGKPYGYGVCASIPDSVTIPEDLREMLLPGGLYAMTESSDDIGASWQALMKYLSSNDKYKPNHSELCLEEHIRNDNPNGSGNEYYLNLLQPVTLKT